MTDRSANEARLTRPDTAPDGVVEAYAAIRKIAVEHLKDHPHIERTSRLMAFPQSFPALASLPDARQSERWQPIETIDEPTALSSGEGVLIADSSGSVGEAYFRNFGDESDGWWWVNTSWGDYPEPHRPEQPTHWRPLPEPPRAALDTNHTGAE